ncbi:MAG TPA: VWA domain-containing protein [Balneolales bacterium]|nr:VWA domain-containing protein [Balneolales bacterium]
MIWQNINYLWYLLLLPVMGAVAYFAYLRKKKLRSSYFSDSLFKDLYKRYWYLGNRLKNAFLFIGLLLLIVALAGPKIGTSVREVKRRGVDLLIALDLSSSMNAEDVSPSRLDKAKYELTHLLDKLSGDRVGLIEFTGDAFLESPLTLDYSTIRMYLNIANTDQMPNTTTNFNAAMQAALKAFEQGDQNTNNSDSQPAKVLLIVSDGENQSYSYTSSLNDLVKKHVDIFTLGVGTEQGGAIPIRDNSGALIGYQRDQNGRVVTTHLEPNTLQKIAQQGHGDYFQIQQSSDDISAFVNRINELQKGTFGEQEYADYKNQYQVLAIIGLAFVLLSFFLPRTRKEKRSEELQLT